MSIPSNPSRGHHVFAELSDRLAARAAHAGAALLSGDPHTTMLARQTFSCEEHWQITSPYTAIALTPEVQATTGPLERWLTELLADAVPAGQDASGAKQRTWIVVPSVVLHFAGLTGTRLAAVDPRWVHTSTATGALPAAVVHVPARLPYPFQMLQYHPHQRDVDDLAEIVLALRNAVQAFGHAATDVQWTGQYTARNTRAIAGTLVRSTRGGDLLARVQITTDPATGRLSEDMHATHGVLTGPRAPAVWLNGEQVGDLVGMGVLERLHAVAGHTVV